MTAGVPLILRKDPVGSKGPTTPRAADVAVVYSTADGQVDVFDSGRRDRWTNRVLARYKWRYEVDLGDHRRTVEFRTTPLPARGGAYDFDSTLDVGFRVVDAGAIVARDVTDGLAVVYGHLINVCRPITRDFDIDDSVGAEDAINARFRLGEKLDEGILIYRCKARLSSSGYAEFVREQVRARRENIVSAERHEKDVDDLRRSNQLATIKQDGELVRRRAERADMGSGELTPAELIREHLARFPSDTNTAMTLLQELERSRWEQREIQTQRANELFRFMADRNLIHPVDVGRFCEQAVGQLSGDRPDALDAAPHSGPAAPAPTPVPPDVWQAPLPSPHGAAPGAPPDALGQAAPDTATPAPGVAPAPPADSWAPSPAPDRPSEGAVASPPSGASPPSVAPDGVVPVYVVIDRSAATEGCVDELNAGVDTLFRSVVEDPDVARVIRLAVIGYAEDASVRIDLTPVADGPPRFRLTTGGEANYSVAFEQLLSCIPRDVASLKGQSSTVRRPQVLFLTGGTPADEASWGPVYQRLVDRHQLRCAPDIIACGFGDSAPATLLRVATSRELAFLAAAGPSGAAVTNFFSFAVRQTIGCAQAALHGYAGPLVTPPPGYRPADPT